MLTRVYKFNNPNTTKINNNKNPKHKGTKNEKKKKKKSKFCNTKSKKKKKKELAKHRRDTHNVVHVGMEDTEKVLLYSLVGIATNIKGYIERRENYVGFMACN